MSASAEVSGGSHHQPALFFLPPKRTADEAIPKICRVQIQRGKVEIGVEEAQTQELFGRERIKKFFLGIKGLAWLCSLLFPARKFWWKRRCVPRILHGNSMWGMGRTKLSADPLKGSEAFPHPLRKRFHWWKQGKCWKWKLPKYPWVKWCWGISLISDEQLNQI